MQAFVKLLIFMIVAIAMRPAFAQSQCWAVFNPARAALFERETYQTHTPENLRHRLNHRALKHFDFAEYEWALRELQDPNRYRLLVTTFEQRLAFLEHARRQTLDPATYRQSIVDELSLLNRRHRNKVVRQIRRMDFSSPTFNRDVQKLSSRLHLVMRGHSLRFSDLFFRTQDQRIERAASELFQEKLLHDGLEKTLSQVYPREATLRSRLRASIRSFLRRPIWNYTTVPLTLPEMRLNELPRDLTERALLDGEPSIRNEVQENIRDQRHAVYHNQIVRPLWKKMIIALLLTQATIQVPHFKNVIEQQVAAKAEQQADQIVNQLDTATAQARRMRAEISDDILIDILQRTMTREEVWPRAEVEEAALQAYSFVIGRERVLELTRNLPEECNLEVIAGLIGRLDESPFESPVE